MDAINRLYPMGKVHLIQLNINYTQKYRHKRNNIYSKIKRSGIQDRNEQKSHKAHNIYYVKYSVIIKIDVTKPGLNISLATDTSLTGLDN